MYNTNFLHDEAQIGDQIYIPSSLAKYH